MNAQNQKNLLKQLASLALVASASTLFSLPALALVNNRAGSAEANPVTRQFLAQNTPESGQPNSGGQPDTGGGTGGSNTSGSTGGSDTGVRSRGSQTPSTSALTEPNPPAEVPSPTLQQFGV